MNRLINFLLGMVTLTAAGPFPERLVNLCAQEGVEFWGTQWLDAHTLRLTVRRRFLPVLRRLAQRANCQLQVERSRGLPAFLGRFRTRYAFLVGLTLSLCAVSFLSRFVLTIQVTGNHEIPTAVILSQLRQQGIRPGVYGPAIDRKQAAQEAVLALDGLAWMGINLYGTRLEVIVREAVPVPEQIDESGFVHIASQADGIVIHVEAELGDAVVQEGDTVTRGDVLISGQVTLEPPKYSDLPNRYYQTHARGRVWARTWRTLTAAIPLQAQVKEYTGEEKQVWSVNLLGRRVEIFGNSSIPWSFYDKITSVHQAGLPDGTALPLSLSCETYRAYQTRTEELNREAAQDLLEKQLIRQLESLVGEDGTVESTQFSARVKDGLLQVTLQAQCLEEIGEEIPGYDLAPDAADSGEDASSP